MWTGIGIWMGWAAEEVCGGAGPYVVAQLLGSGLSFPVCHPRSHRISPNLRIFFQIFV